MQTRKEPEPIFKLISEEGHDRSKEFKVEVIILDDFVILI